MKTLGMYALALVVSTCFYGPMVLAQGLLATGGGQKILKQQSETKTAAPPQAAHPCTLKDMNPVGEDGSWIVPDNVFKARLSRPVGAGVKGDQGAEISWILMTLGICNVIENVSFTVKSDTAVVEGLQSPLDKAVHRIWNDTMIVILHHKPEFDVPKGTR